MTRLDIVVTQLWDVNEQRIAFFGVASNEPLLLCEDCCSNANNINQRAPIGEIVDKSSRPHFTVPWSLARRPDHAAIYHGPNW